MNILPKKNWHVRKKENIARVRKDEAEAAEKEKEIEKRAKLAEQEARVAFLRKRARIDKDEKFHSETSPAELPEGKIEADIFTASGNINFFKETEAGETKTGTNKEHEEEKKAEKEAYEKKIGLLTYLGQDSLEATGKKAWFTERDHIVSKISKDNAEDQEIGLKSKVKVDPLNEIMKHTNTKRFPTVTNNNIDLSIISKKNGKATKSKNLCRKDKRHKKEKKKKKKRKKHEFASDSETESRGKKKYSQKKKRKKKLEERTSEEESDDEEEKQRQLAKLRKERLEREARERKREERLLAGKNPDREENEAKKSELAFKQKYNSQFNPHLAKQNQDKVEPQATLQAGVKYWLS